MARTWETGRLGTGLSTPAVGERTYRLAELRSASVEEIRSGVLDAPQAYDQDHDEWVVVLDGSARLEVDGSTVELGPGDWLLLPARVPHRLLATEAGTSWLAVRSPP